ncbi:MAG: hypothetical protein A2133_11780 [Actinobacteria bacterium RBG_16_64_13]|nr:MAG: hypothetical protein A2133_11780 [Actinobacteria bacterium RBG_16_64_13]
MAANEPERQCIGCGYRGAQSGFLRLTVDLDTEPPRVVVAGEAVRRGRGAYLCRRRACLDRALHRRAFQRAFRASVMVAEEELAAALECAPAGGQANEMGE